MIRNQSIIKKLMAIELLISISTLMIKTTMTAHITMNTKANLENDHHQSNNQDRWETS
jgi:hypothetical protein